jgi:hypothetical protein
VTDEHLVGSEGMVSRARYRKTAAALWEVTPPNASPADIARTVYAMTDRVNAKSQKLCATN